jgi:PAS domain-containing protein
MAIALREMESRFVWVNRRFETLFNVRRGESVGATHRRSDARAVGRTSSSPRRRSLGQRNRECTLAFARNRRRDSTLRITEVSRTRSRWHAIWNVYDCARRDRAENHRNGVRTNPCINGLAACQLPVSGGCARSRRPYPLGERAKHYDAQSARAIETQATIREELQLDFGPEERTIEFSKFPLYDAGGEVFGVEGTANDATDQRRLED